MATLDIDSLIPDNELNTLLGIGAGFQEEEEEKEKEKQKEQPVEIEELFQSESVDRDEDIEVEEDTPPDGGTSPNVFSSFATTLRERGIFQDLDDTTIEGITDEDTFIDAVEAQIQSKFDERYKRIDDALNADIAPSVVKQYEAVLAWLEDMTPHVEDEGSQGEDIRKRLIYQDFVNRGFTPEKASKEVQKSFNAGTDIEDAKEALLGNKQYYSEQYNGLIKQAQAEKKQEETNRKKEAENLRKSIIDNEKFFDDLVLDKTTRKKIYDSITKPVYKDPETKEYLTAVQKFERDNHNEFMKFLATCYTLTDGGKNLNKLIKQPVKKAVNKGLSKLEAALNTTSRNAEGSLNFINGDGGGNTKASEWNLDL